MGLEILQQGLELLGAGKTTPGEGPAASLFGKIIEAVGLKKPELAKEATDAKESAEKSRFDIFGDVGKSLFLREFPRLAAVFDIANAGKKLKDKLASKSITEFTLEDFKDVFLNFSTLSSLLILVPNEWKHVITDLLAESTIFQKLVEYWPGLDGVDLPIIGKTGAMAADIPVLGKGGSLRDRILNEKDPNAVIEALRIMHQDVFVTGKVSFDWIKEKLGTGGALATVAGGAAALTLAEQLLGGKD